MNAFIYIDLVTFDVTLTIFINTCDNSCWVLIQWCSKSKDNIIQNADYYMQ